MICFGFIFDDELARQLFQIDQVGRDGPREAEYHEGTGHGHVRAIGERQDLERYIWQLSHRDQVGELPSHHVSPAHTTPQRAFVQDYTSLVTVRIVEGLGLGAEVPLVYTFVSELVPVRRRGLLLTGSAFFWHWPSVPKRP